MWSFTVESHNGSEKNTVRVRGNVTVVTVLLYRCVCDIETLSEPSIRKRVESEPSYTKYLCMLILVCRGTSMWYCMCHPVGQQTDNRFIYLYIKIIRIQYPVPQSGHTRSHTDGRTDTHQTKL